MEKSKMQIKLLDGKVKRTCHLTAYQVEALKILSRKNYEDKIRLDLRYYLKIPSKNTDYAYATEKIRGEED